LEDVENAVTALAVTVLQARGEPASAERLLGEVLIGLDRLGHLRRLVATQTFTETEAATETDDGGPPAEEDTESHAPGAVPPTQEGEQPAAAETDIQQPPDWALSSASA